MAAFRAASALIQSEQLFSFAAICFAQEIAHMELDGIFRNIEPLCDLFIGTAADHHSEYVRLTLGQVIACSKGLDVVHLRRNGVHIHSVIQMKEEKDTYNKKQCHHGDKDHRPAAEHDSRRSTCSISETAPHEADAGQMCEILAF